MIAAEAVPFVKSGGLADVVGSLPKALVAGGADVRVMLPKYEDIPANLLASAEPVAEFTVQVGWRRQYCGVSRLSHEGITYYLLDNEFYFKRPGLYGYGDDGERFAYFCQAALEAISRLGWKPDVLHCHDWHTALVPVFLRAHYGWNDFYAGMRSVFTIHNLKYQGVFGYGALRDLLNLGDEHFHANALEFYGNVNYMKGALNYSDFLTTVSPTYAKEIQTPHYGEGLDGTLRHRRDALLGIVNGIDYDALDPGTDPHLPAHYRLFAKDDPGKAANKAALQQELGLPVRTDTPIVSLVTRLVEQKGIDLISHVLEELLREELQLVVLGAGESRYEKLFRDAAYHHPARMSTNLKFDEGLARRIYAGSDLFLMPSKFEPCGIGQMIAIRYGTAPIVRETGGLVDTVKPYNRYTGEGHGFSFTHYNAHEMLDTIRFALGIYRDEAHWSAVRSNVAAQDFSWNASAKQYLELYASLISK
ncbi:glycogen synthase GlgA [Paenibacillus sp.]|uniref:glycogen synthase GlgA n=1 Tax=Paenibacillus sp. TaxID=58172 RepID=UPI002811FEBF|nr:glycogen synthase GlgA [Paenibacillus sp.]